MNVGKETMSNGTESAKRLSVLSLMLFVVSCGNEKGDSRPSGSDEPASSTQPQSPTTPVKQVSPNGVPSNPNDPWANPKPPPAATEPTETPVTKKAAQHPLRAAREGFVEEYAQQNADGALPFAFSLGEDDRDLVVKTSGRCSEALLKKLVELSGEHMRNVRFQRLVCGDGAAVEKL